MMNDTVAVIGAGLAGVEAAWQIANAGHRVRLFEMKPVKFSPAHKSADFAELICSNSLKAARVDSAAGLLKEEMRRMGSLLVACADAPFPRCGPTLKTLKSCTASTTSYRRTPPSPPPSAPACAV